MSSYPQTFPTVLLQILSDQSNADVITWLPHGLAFCILDRDKLLQEVLPRYFPDRIKFSSLARKLKRWGFVRVPSGGGDLAFYNRHFNRDNPSLDQMRPQHSKAATFPVEFAMPACGYKVTDNLPHVPESTKNSVVEHRPLKKRPVDVSSLKLSAKQQHQASLPEPKLIRVVPVQTTPPTILQACSRDDIERQGLLIRNKLKCTSQQQQQGSHKRELLLRQLLKRQLLREESKAKQHFHQHYSSSAARESLLHRLQQELHQQHRAVSPSQRNPEIVQDLLQACNSSSRSSSMVLSNEQPLYCRNPYEAPHHHLFNKRNGGSGRVKYDYAHCA